MLIPSLFFLSCSLSLGAGFRKGMDSVGKRHYQIQHGPCSYSFLLPEMDNCRSVPTHYVSNTVQRDAPETDNEGSMQRLQQLENIMENNTQWLQKLESYIQDNMKSEMVQMQQNAVQNQTAAMLEIGTNLLTKTAEQTRKLTDVEAQVLNQTSRLEVQLLENALSTHKLEKEIMVQTSEITKLHQKNGLLEQKVSEIEDKHEVELQSLKQEKEQLQKLVTRQNSIIEELEKQLATATLNSTVLQKQQLDLIETVHNLINLVSPTHSKSLVLAKEEQIRFKDCAEAFKSGLTTNGIYTLFIPNTTQPIKAFCNMESSGGGWTVLQRREDGNMDFHRTWKEYRMGFGDPAGEHWLGNEFVYKLTSQKNYALRIQLRDWEGNEAFSLYDQFYLASEARKYRIHLKGYSGTAGKISSISQLGNDFSTKDSDNDKCICRCSQMTSGGWWFDACGPSNLNGLYYSLGQNTNRFNGIKWYYWKGSGYSLKGSTMMIRPADF
ncbi:angiopoietin-2a [Callorhinchus milii]|uniref:angiopoietin-2a n=1 Tax=Callorhinchus milii TaxID=7868 RepID=UPI0004574232|nr:angiopoietin-2a [Callorhinchus milii]|eukprot:gi/632953111/ref/XP_007892227.1/ PREDICTED: angiopoietin-2 [Callorhinchus milii]